MTSTKAARSLDNARVIVVKLGSAVLTTPTGDLDRAVLRDVTDTVAHLCSEGRRVIMVSSGAVAAGRSSLAMLGKTATIAEKQALAAVGQTRLMQVYSEEFSQHGLVVGQMLLSREDMEDRRRYLNARYTLEELLRRRCVPIINENDTVTVDELKFGDNDGLAALVAVKMMADALVILSDVDGVFDRNPKIYADARLLDVVERVTDDMLDTAPLTTQTPVSVGSGGMRSKLLAAQTATADGVRVVIANGKVPGTLRQVVSADFRGTYFPAQPRRHSRIQQWMLSKKSVNGRRIHIDAGARAALLEKKKSLLAAGIREVEGSFQQGDIVEIVDAGGTILGRGAVNYSSAELGLIKGCKSSEIQKILGQKTYDEVIHRDYLVLAGD